MFLLLSQKTPSLALSSSPKNHNEVSSLTLLKFFFNYHLISSRKFLIIILTVTFLGKIHCNKDLYAQLFEDFFNDENNARPDISGKEYYCVRLLAEKKHLVNYKININPKNINVMNTDCSKFIASAKNEAAIALASDPSLSEDQKNCVKKTFLRGNYFKYLAVVMALAQAEGLTVDQRANEKTKFIEKMGEMSEKLNECVLVKDGKID